MFKRIACVAWLLPTLALAQPLDNVVAVVNDGVITASELNAQVRIMRQQIAAKKMQLPADQILRKQVLQHLIDVDLEMQLAKQNDLTIDNTELDEAIAKIASNNQLSLAALREAVGHQGLTWVTYRENIRKEMLISRLQQKAVGKEVKVSAQQIEDYLKTFSEQDKTQYTFHLQNMVVPMPEEPTPEQLKNATLKARDILAKINKGKPFANAAIEESNNDFSLETNDLGVRHLTELPQLFAKKVVKMKVGQVIGPIRAGNGLQLIKLVAIAGNQEKHEVVKTHVRHILLKEGTSMTTGEVSKQANNLYIQLNSGKDFVVTAKKYSQDITTAVKGGDLGWVTPGELVPAFEKTMDALPLNKISKPVKTAFGWHLIQVLGRKKVDDSASFKRQQVRAFLQQKKFGEAVQNWQQHLRTNAYIKIMDKALV